MVFHEPVPNSKRGSHLALKSVALAGAWPYTASHSFQLPGFQASACTGPSLSLITSHYQQIPPVGVVFHGYENQVQDCSPIYVVKFKAGQHWLQVGPKKKKTIWPDTNLSPCISLTDVACLEKLSYLSLLFLTTQNLIKIFYFSCAFKVGLPHNAPLPPNCGRDKVPIYTALNPV